MSGRFTFERAGQLATPSPEPRVKGKSTDGRKSSARKDDGPSQILAACRLLLSKGFDLYRNKRSDAVAARSSGFMFEFDGLSIRKAHAFYTDSDHCADRAGSGLVQRSVL